MSTPQPPATLDRERVLTAAVELADEIGLEATSMRRLAERLGVTPMALYNHVANREELVDGMVETVIAGIDPPRLGGDWRARVRARILAARRALESHVWALDAIESRTQAGPAVLAHMDALIADMLAGGLSPDLTHHAMHALSTRMWGFTRDVFPTPRLPDDPAQRNTALAEYAVRYPGIVRMAREAPRSGAGCDADAELEFALDVLLDGIDRLRAAGWSSV